MRWKFWQWEGSQAQKKLKSLETQLRADLGHAIVSVDHTHPHEHEEKAHSQEGRPVV